MNLESNLVMGLTLIQFKFMNNYYLASGFFNPKQIADVEEIEKIFTIDGNLVDCYSPRKHGVLKDMKMDSDFNKNIFINKILQTNIVEINKALNIIVNCRNYDLGTMWELGYFIGKNRESYHNQVILMNDEESKVDQFLFEFSKILVNYSDIMKPQSNRVVVDKSGHISFNPELLSSDDSEVLISIDDRNFKNMILLGYLYSTRGGGLNLYTYSEAEHGSNIMLAGTIKNHYQNVSPDALDNMTLTTSTNKASFSKIIE